MALLLILLRADRLRRRLWFRNHAAGAKTIFLRCLKCRRHT